MARKIIEKVGELVSELQNQPQDNDVRIMQDDAVMCDLGIEVGQSPIFDETYIKIIQKETEDGQTTKQRRIGCFARKKRKDR